MGVGIAPQRAHKQPFFIVTNNSLSNHSLQKRLLASRGRDKKTKKRYSDE